MSAVAVPLLQSCPGILELQNFQLSIELRVLILDRQIPHRVMTATPKSDYDNSHIFEAGSIENILRNADFCSFSLYRTRFDVSLIIKQWFMACSFIIFLEMLAIAAKPLPPRQYWRQINRLCTIFGPSLFIGVSSGLCVSCVFSDHI